MEHTPIWEYCEDGLGKYRVDISRKPIDIHTEVDTEKFTLVKVDIFDNTKKHNASDYVVSLSIQQNKRFTNYFASMLNRFDKHAFHRNNSLETEKYHTQIRDHIKHLRRYAKQNNLKFEIEPTAGYFHEPRKGNHENLTYSWATCIMYMLEDDYSPTVFIRFFDANWVLDDFVENTKSSPTNSHSRYSEKIALAKSNKIVEI